MIIEVNDMNFRQEVYTTDQTIVADFWAPWCGPCRMLSPIIEDLSNELYKDVKFIKINIEASPNLADFFRIQSIPAILIFKKGKVVKNLVGFTPKPMLLDAIKKASKSK